MLLYLTLRKYDPPSIWLVNRFLPHNQIDGKSKNQKDLWSLAQTLKKGPFGTWNISTYFVIVLRNPKGEETDKIQWRTFAIIVKRGICFTVQKFNHFSAIQILRVMTHKNSNYGRILKLATFIVGNVRNSPKLILRKIWVTEKLLNFYTLKT